MLVPDFTRLRQERSECQRLEQQCDCKGFAQGVHSNPRFFKYYWWVFWNESPIDGREFLSTRYRLSTASAQKLMDELKARNEPYWLYNIKVPRLGSAIPFDLQSPRWQGIEWAPSYDDDSDAMAERSLSNHK